MNTFYFIFALAQVLFQSSSALAQNLTTANLQTGDVLLLSLNCYECRMIESETNSQFSHSGIVLYDENNSLKIGESLGTVRLSDLSNFSKNISSGTQIHVYRPKEFFNSPPEKNLSQILFSTFTHQFFGAPFDSDFLWNNSNEDGRELFYCAEFIAKLLNTELANPIKPQPMRFSKNIAYWKKYFGNKEPPDGKLGLSPSSFSKNRRLKFIGTL